MPTSPIWRSTRSPLAHRAAAIGLLGALSLALTGLVGAASASAAVATPSVPQPVSVTPVPSAELEEVLSKVPLKDLPTTRLSEVLAKLPGLSSFPEPPVKEALTKAIEELEAQEGTLGQLAGNELVSRLEPELNTLLSGELSSLLHGRTLSSVLSEAVDSLNDRQVVGELLGSAGEPEQLIERVLKAPSSTGEIEKLLGTTLNGEPVSTSTVGELASQIGTTPEGLAQALGTTSSQLPASALAMTAPLADGKKVAVFDAAEGIDLGTLGTGHELLSEGATGAPGGNGGSTAGGAGGPGGASSGASGGTTTLQEIPSAQSATPAASSKALGKVKVVSRKVKGKTLTLVVQVPAAGTLEVTGKGLRSAGRQTDRAERVTLRVVLTRARLASLRKTHHRLTVNLMVSFRPVSGAGSKATSTVAFA